MPSRHPIERSRVRIEQQLGGVEPMPRGRIVGPAYAIPVALTGANPAKVPMPDVFSALGQPNSRNLLVTPRAAKQAQRRASRVLGKYRKVHPSAVKGGAKRIWHAGQSYEFGIRHFEPDTNGKRE